MLTYNIVRLARTSVSGDGPTNPLGRGGESPSTPKSVLLYLSEQQIQRYVAFSMAHGFYAFESDRGCTTEATLSWLADFQTVEYVTLTCECCGITRTFDRDGKEVI